ncbi:GNAT family N-acetyltransferase [Paenibacillus oralis]|uniref:GNAT family N-acetyltransferase n=1 Tax=Paenibacillus oralis TaxID=2490856 RepID=A0A3P3U6Q2_9BACL|nr:GNAT family N-acetyltransferase [Paenibacillus oralis]RRJ66047.1 GNAT family N-acetyltransferase [Paenibacillus oralis]
MPFIEINEDLRQEVGSIFGDIIVSCGQIHRVEELRGFVFIEENQIQGSIFYNVSGQECEIVSLECKLEGKGIGSKLIQLVIERAESLDCKRVWLITSNDNIKAIRFYQKRGFDMVCIHKNAITEARILKPSIPLYGYDEIPIKHEVEFEYILNDFGG